jgi:hypothetical protein
MIIDDPPTDTMTPRADGSELPPLTTAQRTGGASADEKSLFGPNQDGRPADAKAGPLQPS